MLYDYQYEAAAAVVTLMTFAVYIIRRSFITKSNRIFGWILVCNFISSILNVISCFTISYPDRFPLGFNYAVSLGYLFFYDLLSVLFFVYIDAKARIREFQKPVQYTAIINVIFYIVVIFSSPWTHWVAYFDADRVYCHGPVMNILFIIPYVFFIWECIIFYIARNKFNRYQIMASVVLIVGMSLSVLVSFIFPRILFGSFAMSVIFFFIYVSFENPAYFTYKDTQCLNRNAFYETTRRMIRANKRFHIVSFAIQDYEYGRHYIGVKHMEALSAHVADMLYYTFKNNVFCIMDDKFAIVVKENESDMQSVEKIKELFRHPMKFGKNETNVSVVIRTLLNIDSSFEPDDMEDLLEYRLTHPDENVEAGVLMKTVLEKRYHRDQILHIIKRALANDEFMVYYQPIYSVKTGRFQSAEALVRLYDKDIGFLDPEELITIAEENGYINQIGEVVFEKVCRFMHERKVRELGISYIEINLSPVQCMNEDLVKRFTEIMSAYEVEPESMNLEITETAQMSNESQMFKNISVFNRMGIRFSIDDYGSGFAAASYLIKLPVSIVKIDKSILWMAMREPGAMIVLKNTILMLKELGKEIVVEGVENQEMVDVLTEYGCDFLQGYYYSKPINEGKFVEYLQQNDM